jgi:hypothetical protein
MRQRTLLGDLGQTSQPAREETAEQVRRTLDEALDELQLPLLDREDSGLIRIFPLPR